MKESNLQRVLKFLYKFIFVLIVLYLAYLFKLSEGLANSLISQDKIFELIIIILIPLIPIVLIVLLYFVVKRKSRKKAL